MKQLVLTSMILASFSYCQAQETHVIEPAILEITYNVTHGKDKDIYALRCGKNVSQYFSKASYRNDSLRASPDINISTIPLYESLEAIKNRNDPSKQLPSSPGHND
jgi:hypothetical protein